MSKPKSSKKKQALAPTDRAHVYFSGRVQGVGFRHVTQETALSMAILGWVKNLHDGRVEVVAESDKQTLEEFLGRMRGGPMGPYIKKVDCAWETATGEFSDFSVEFHF